VRNEYGKPRVEPECGLRFNLANSVGLVVCVAGWGGEVGVDVEPYARAGEILELAGEVFSALETVELERLPHEKKLDRALSLWTLKEAYIKARGIGLSLPLKEISFLFDDAEEIRLELGSGVHDDPAHWRFCLADRAEHRVAVICETMDEAELDLIELRPLGAAPERLQGIAIQWFPR
jgi:4'-phosphopantetheinyl transferase